MVKQIATVTGLILVVALVLCPVFLPAGVSKALVSVKSDLDHDGVTEEYSLDGEGITVREKDQVLWKSPDAWKVQAFAIGDLDNDGSVNLAVSLWKKGSFGETLPFWHKGKDKSYKNHMFIYKLVDDNFKSVWCSSNLDNPIVSLTISDINGDGLNELIVEEGQYRKVFGERYALDENAPIKSTVWQWDQWGFRLKGPVDTMMP